MDGGVLRHVHLENHVLMPRCAAAGRLAGPLAQALAEDHRRLDELLAPAIDAMPLDAEARAPGGASSCATCNGDMQR